MDAKIASNSEDIPVPYDDDWFLPMIHFDFNKYSLKNSSYASLHHVATVMKQNLNVKVVVTGHTDKTSSNCYNEVLSYNRAETAINYLTTKYGISRDRFVLRYGGEENTLVATNAQNLMNRRVEFSLANGETEMGKPDCRANAGSGAGGTNYSGNEEQDY